MYVKHLEQCLAINGIFLPIEWECTFTGHTVCTRYYALKSYSVNFPIIWDSDDPHFTGTESKMKWNKWKKEWPKATPSLLHPSLNTSEDKWALKTFSQASATYQVMHACHFTLCYSDQTNRYAWKQKTRKYTKMLLLGDKTKGDIFLLFFYILPIVYNEHLSF